MRAQTAVAVTAALVALAFSMATFERWRAGGRAHDGVWALAMAMFAAAAGALAAGAAAGWGGVDFRIFYLFGAILDVPWLAVGTVYLHAGPTVARRWAAGVALASALAIGVLAAAPFTHQVPMHRLPQGSQVFGPMPRILAATFSAGGALVVIAGALRSAWRVRRRRIVASNTLVVLGTLVLGASGLLNSVVGQMSAFAVTLTTGVVILFIGFLVATSRPAGGVAAMPVASLGPAALSREESDAAASRSTPEEASRPA
jgi:MFS family permease